MNLDLARALADQLVAALAPDPPPSSVVVDTPDALDRAISLAVAGDRVLLDPTLVYPAPLLLTKSITLESQTFEARRGLRMTVDEPAPRFLAGLSGVGDDQGFRGIDVRHTNPLTTILLVSGARAVLDRVRVLGDPVLGGKRGIDYTGSAGQILNVYINDIFQPAQDTQALYSSSMGRGLVIDNGYFCAAGESIMFGGGDAITEDRAPSGILLTRSTLTKKPAWLELVSGSFATGTAKHRQQCKNALEFKHVNGAVVADCDLEYAGVSQGQGAYLIVCTPRNQSGREPWTTVKNVQITNCRGRHASGAAQFLGDDNINPSQRLTDVSLNHCTFEDLDKAVYGGSGRIFYINRAPDGVTLDSLTATGTNLKSIVYFDETRPPTRLTLRHLTMPTGLPYAYHNPFGDTLASVQVFAPDAVLEP